MESKRKSQEMLTKIGIYSIILPFYGFLEKWEILYWMLNSKFKVFWKAHIKEFKEISKKSGLNLIQLQNLNIKEKFCNKLMYTLENVLIIDCWSYRKEILESIFDFLIELEPAKLLNLKFERPIDLSNLISKYLLFPYIHIWKYL